VRFKVDENLPEETAVLLRRAGYDASTVLDQEMEGESDKDLSLACQREQRALITLDLGFADIRTFPPKEYYGLLVLRLKRQDKIHVIGTIERLLSVLETEPLMSRLWIVEDERVRIRD
jgi:predicted nuclease of predicted toxin-antitoxin system